MKPHSKSFFELLTTYDRPAPRYVSYPTVPYWSDPPSTAEWLNYACKALTTQDHRNNPDNRDNRDNRDDQSNQDNQGNSRDATVGIYIHIPFCERLCSFCACNTYITGDHSLEMPYIKAVHRELELYLEQLPALAEKKIIALHLGGGTPNFLQADHLQYLLDPFLSCLRPAVQKEFSAEFDPRFVHTEQLAVLRAAGFDRLSLGIQDFAPQVQQIVGRIQSFEQSAYVFYEARRLGFSSINFDLIYGLPLQTVESFQRSVEMVLKLRPERIALYSYAHVPWIQEAQRLFTEKALPRGAAKYRLYELARNAFEKAGYGEIGMDHFALPSDPLWKACDDGQLDRNFMGYSSKPASLLLGLGSSAISDSGNCYHQNEKALMKYQKRVEKGVIPTLRGHKLTSEDSRRRRLILRLTTAWSAELPRPILEEVRPLLQPFEKEGLLHYEGCQLIITTRGRPFLRLICAALDLRMKQKAAASLQFSRAI